MASSDRTEAFLEWCGMLWGTGAADDERTIAAVEQRLGVTLPPLLRAVYLHTSLRDSQMLHLSELSELELRDGALVFARDQQACWYWGVPVDRLQHEDPALVADPAGRWEDDRCTLDGFLRYYLLTNRPYEPPFIDQSSYEDHLLVGPWKKLVVEWKSLQHASLWTNGEAVLDQGVGNLGAKDAGALRRAAASLGIEAEEVDAALEDNGE